MAQVVIYTKSYCPFCVKVKGLFEEKGVSFTEIDVETNDQTRAEMVEKSGGRMTVPQVFINGHHIGGCDDTYELDDSGELDELLNS
jgi:glutaredoxin 3